MIYDCIIIGAGPGGLSSAIYLGRARKKTLLIYSGPRRTALAVHIQNYLGFKDISGQELIDIGLKQAESYGVETLTATVKNIKQKGKEFEIITASESFSAKKIIIASGIDDILPDIDNIFEYIGESFFTCFDCDGYHLTGKKVCIIGKGDSSARTALAIKQTYTDKMFIAIGKEESISPEYLKKLEKEKIEIVRKDAKHLNGREGILESVDFEDGTSLKCDFVLSDLGYTRNDSFLAELEIKRSEKGYIEVNSNFESSIKGIFVIGPLNTGQDQVSVAVGEGAQAAMHIIEEDFIF